MIKRKRLVDYRINTNRDINNSYGGGKLMTLTLSQSSIEELNRIAEFIARMNCIPENHIGYCGKNAEEIMSTWKKDFTDVPAENAFISALDENNIIGVCGFDADYERKTVDIWGPFIKNNDALETSSILLEALLKKIPDQIDSVTLFPDIRNRLVIDTGKYLGFKPVSKQTILTCTNQTLKAKKTQSVSKLPASHNEAFINLHNSTFPSSYLSGEEILQGLNDEAAVFGVIEEDNLIGYLYAEANPTYCEGSIEFFGVDTNARGKGIGTTLLTGGLQWLFSFPSIKEISLCVRSDNEHAIHMYKKIGFQEEHNLILLQKNK